MEDNVCVFPKVVSFSPSCALILSISKRGPQLQKGLCWALGTAVGTARVWAAGIRGAAFCPRWGGSSALFRPSNPVHGGTPMDSNVASQWVYSSYTVNTETYPRCAMCEQPALPPQLPSSSPLRLFPSLKQPLALKQQWLGFRQMST